MGQKLSTGKFKWVEDVSKFTPQRISELINGNKGYLLEVDISYPTELHDSHNDLLFLPEKMALNGVTKLVPNLYRKKKYMVHINLLDQATQTQIDSG